MVECCVGDSWLVVVLVELDDVDMCVVVIVE